MRALLQTAPGVAVAALIGSIAYTLGSHYGAPVMLFALLLGMAASFLAARPRYQRGVTFASKGLLRIGVALLGLRLSFDDILSLGWGPMAGTAGLLALTLVCGVVLAKLLGKSLAFGVLAGGAVAICGASAALAIAAVLPMNQRSERDILFTVAGVTSLSTIAMIVYPWLFIELGFTPFQSGFLIGATIHDVAQVVGAGYTLGHEAGDIATFVKLQRVALLPVVLAVVMFAFRGQSGGQIQLPWFLLGFVWLMLVGNLMPIPDWIRGAVNSASSAALVVAISALGMRTSLKQMADLGWGHAFLLVATTLVLLAAALGFAAWYF